MDFSHSEKVRDLQERLTQFMENHVYPAEALYHKELEENRRAGNPWQVTKVVEHLKKKAKAAPRKKAKKKAAKKSAKRRKRR